MSELERRMAPLEREREPGEEAAEPGRESSGLERRLAELALRVGVHVEYLGQTTSTNDIARDGRFRHGDVVVAGAQTAGRGQRGNGWSSAAGENLIFSVVLEPHALPAAEQFLLSEAVSLAVADTLESYGIDARVKWPNDIYLGDRKVAGILIENDIMGSCISRSIVGVGLNVNQTAFPAELPNPVSMSIAAGREYDLDRVLESFLVRLSARLSGLFEGDSGGVGAGDVLDSGVGVGDASIRASSIRDSIRSAYHERLYRRGVPARYHLPGAGAFTGTIEGVGPGGELLVRDDDGRLAGYLFKEIEFVI